jgi:hypothetical protein
MDWHHAGHMKCAQASFAIFGVKELIFGTELPSLGYWLLLVISEMISHLEKYDHTITQLKKLSEKRERERVDVVPVAVIIPLQSRLHLFEMERRGKVATWIKPVSLWGHTFSDLWMFSAVKQERF